MQQVGEIIASEEGEQQAAQARPQGSLAQRVLEILRGLFWSTFGIAGHLALVVVGLLLAVAVIVSPIIILAVLIELVAWLLP